MTPDKPQNRNVLATPPGRLLLGLARDDLLKMRPVSPLVNSVKNDGPELME